MKTSSVWDHFSLTADKKQTKCKVCGVVFSYSGSTSNMMKHVAVHNNDLAATSSSSTKIQQTLPGMMAKKVSSPRQAKITELLIDVITENALPLHFSESPSVRKLLNYLEPGYQVPCYESIRKGVQDEGKKYETQFQIYCHEHHILP